jgi:hypothetical protein
VSIVRCLGETLSEYLNDPEFGGAPSPGFRRSARMSSFDVQGAENNR